MSVLTSVLKRVIEGPRNNPPIPPPTLLYDDLTDHYKISDSGSDRLQLRD